MRRFTGFGRALGFTLVELLLALGLFSVAGVAAASALRAGVEAWRRTEEASRVTQQARIVLDELAFELRKSLLVPGSPFMGSPDSVAFDAQVNLGGRSGIFRLNYSVDPESGELVKSGLAYGEDEEERRGAVTSGLSRFSFKFPYGCKRRDGPPTWKEDWAFPAVLPPAVLVELDLSDSYGKVHGFSRIIWVPGGRRS